MTDGLHAGAWAPALRNAAEGILPHHADQLRAGWHAGGFTGAWRVTLVVIGFAGDVIAIGVCVLFFRALRQKLRRTYGPPADIAEGDRTLLAHSGIRSAVVGVMVLAGMAMGGTPYWIIIERVANIMVAGHTALGSLGFLGVQSEFISSRNIAICSIYYVTLWSNEPLYPWVALWVLLSECCNLATLFWRTRREALIFLTLAWPAARIAPFALGAAAAFQEQRHLMFITKAALTAWHAAWYSCILRAFYARLCPPSRALTRRINI